jgi:hypothetical protein
MAGGAAPDRDPALLAHRRAADPVAWLAEHLAARYDEHAEELEDPDAVRVVGIAEVLADDATLLRGIHTGLQHDGTPPAAAALYLADWYAGAIAGALGFCLAVGGAGYVVDPSEVRWHLHPDGWPMRVELGRPSDVLVAGGHPWGGRHDVVVLSADEVIERAVAGLVTAVAPVVDACRGLAPVGRAGLWNEVADGLGMALAFQLGVPVADPMVAVLDAAVRVPGVPWKAKPALRWAGSTLGRIHVAQKGGCCLAYTRPDVAPEDEDEAPDPEHAEYLARFPRRPGEPRYCSTCSFRDEGDCDARQVYWLERTARTRTTAG